MSRKVNIKYEKYILNMMDVLNAHVPLEKAKSKGNEHFSDIRVKKTLIVIS